MGNTTFALSVVASTAAATIGAVLFGLQLSGLTPAQSVAGNLLFVANAVLVAGGVIALSIASVRTKPNQDDNE